MATLVNRRIDIFTNIDESVTVSGEVHTIPSSGEPIIWLKEIPAPGSPIIIETAGGVVSAGITGDTYTDQGFPSTNYSALSVMTTGVRGVPPFHVTRSWIQLDVSALPGPASNVTLRIFLQNMSSASFPSPRSISLSAPFSSWSSGTITWNSQPSIGFSPFTSIIVSTSQYYDFNITNLYNGWKTGSPNRGICITDTVGDSDKNRNWSTSNGTPVQAPEIVVTTASSSMSEVVAWPIIGTLDFAANRGRGALGFHSSLAGQSVSVSYTATGSNIEAQTLCDAL